MDYNFKMGDYVRIIKAPARCGGTRQAPLHSIQQIRSHVYSPNSHVYFDSRQIMISGVDEIELIHKDNISKLEWALYGF